MATSASANKHRLRRRIGVVLLLVVLVFAIQLHKRASVIDGPEVPSVLQVKNYQHPIMRLSNGLTPPTNKWFSSLVFSGAPQPIYAYPLSAKVNENTVELGYPTVKVNEDAVYGAHVPDVALELGTNNRKVTAYDDLSVRIGHYDTKKNLVAQTRITQGSPYSFTEFSKAGTYKLKHIGSVQQSDKQHIIISDGMKTFGAYINDGSFIDAPGDTVTIKANSGGFVSIYIIGEGSDREALATAAEARITKTAVSYAVTNKESKTTYAITTANKQPTVFTSAPQNSSIDGKKLDVSYATILGQHAAYEGTSFTATQATVTPPLALQLGSITKDQRAELVTQLRLDVASTKVGKIDSYFGGKELYRVGNLLELAHQLNDEQSEQKLQKMLVSNLDTWLAESRDSGRLSRKFVYDSTIKGVVGVEPSFGSEHFNDHHFHYGYFIYAASVAAEYDQSFVERNGAVVETLISDIASEKASASYPKFRSFDAYVGHSWASGYSDFADGNNQESSSEAINAWYGVYRWGKATNNNNLSNRGLWLYTNEVASAKHYWLADRQTEFPGYKRTFSSLVWSGKLSAGTFFSAREQDALGIQLIPFSPGQSYLQSLDPNVINAQIRSVAPTNADITGQFSDYIAMYQSITDKAKGLEIARGVPDANIDDANARSYMLAWIYSQK